MEFIFGNKYRHENLRLTLALTKLQLNRGSTQFQMITRDVILNINQKPD